MKIRTAFVSNSSSSSFVINKYFLSGEQIDKIEDHIVVSQDMPYTVGSDYEYDYGDWYNRECDAWVIHEEDGNICGHTFIDNFDMRYFLDQIGVSDKIIKWGD